MANKNENLRNDVSPLCASCPLGLQKLDQGEKLSEEQERFATLECAAWRIIAQQIEDTAACSDHMGFDTSADVKAVVGRGDDVVGGGQWHSRGTGTDFMEY